MAESGLHSRNSLATVFSFLDDYTAVIDSYDILSHFFFNYQNRFRSQTLDRFCRDFFVFFENEPFDRKSNTNRYK